MSGLYQCWAGRKKDHDLERGRALLVATVSVYEEEAAGEIAKLQHELTAGEGEE